MSAPLAIPRRGLMLVLSSPSGAGKTTLSRLLLEGETNLKMSVSATTRAKRPGEVDGHDYIFLGEEEFARRVAAGEFLEHATVFGHRYGTPRAPVEAALRAGEDVLFDIDWQGTQQLREKAREDVVAVFVLPPSRAELERRLRARAQDPPEVVARRMAKANDEISHWAEYDYVVLNQSVPEALAQIEQVLGAERVRRDRQIGLSEFVRGLTDG